MDASTSTEQWLPVVGWEDTYEVSDFGRLRSLTRTLATARGPRRRRAKIMSIERSAGYRRLPLRAIGREVQVYIHTLVLEAFVGPRPDGAVCRHLDGNTDNNHVSNLAWGTPKENSADRERHGHTCKGELVGTAKLTEEDVRAIRSSTLTAKAEAKLRGINRGTVEDIRRRRSWAWLD